MYIPDYEIEESTQISHINQVMEVETKVDQPTLIPQASNSFDMETTRPESTDDQLNHQRLQDPHSTKTQLHVEHKSSTVQLPGMMMNLHSSNKRGQQANASGWEWKLTSTKRWEWIKKSRLKTFIYLLKDLITQ